MHRVVPVPCLSDNYAYLVHAEGSDRALVVDPSEGPPVEAALAREGLALVGVLLTHHHFDHVGGVEALAASRPELPVVASTGELGRIRGATRGVGHEDTFTIGGIEVRALAVPGHTLGALAYVVGGEVFTGDTLFVAGCGRLFEGTPEMMHRSLVEVLGALPGATRVWCGHEYTAANLRFALHLEPDDDGLRAACARAEARRAAGEPTVPSTIADERARNPFLRAGALRHLSGAADAVTSLAWIRAQKDVFRG